MKAGVGRNLEVRPNRLGQGVEDPLGTDGELVCFDTSQGADVHSHSFIHSVKDHTSPTLGIQITLPNTQFMNDAHPQGTHNSGKGFEYM